MSLLEVALIVCLVFRAFQVAGELLAMPSDGRINLPASFLKLLLLHKQCSYLDNDFKSTYK